MSCRSHKSKSDEVCIRLGLGLRLVYGYGTAPVQIGDREAGNASRLAHMMHDFSSRSSDYCTVGSAGPHYGLVSIDRRDKWHSRGRGGVPNTIHYSS